MRGKCASRTQQQREMNCARKLCSESIEKRAKLQPQRDPTTRVQCSAEQCGAVRPVAPESCACRCESESGADGEAEARRCGYRRRQDERSSGRTRQPLRIASLSIDFHARNLRRETQQTISALTTTTAHTKHTSSIVSTKRLLRSSVALGALIVTVTVWVAIFGCPLMVFEATHTKLARAICRRGSFQRSRRSSCIRCEGTCSVSSRRSSMDQRTRGGGVPDAEHSIHTVSFARSSNSTDV